MRFGYRRLTAIPVREGTPANHKRVYRLYREEGLVMRISATAADPLEWRSG
jgi:putative transposase